MNVRIVHGGMVEVKLSRSNLLSLLHKLDQHSYRTIERWDGDVLLVVTAEEDEEHYRDRPRGKMSDDTEDYIVKNAR